MKSLSMKQKCGFFDHDERHVHIGQLFVLLEGLKCVGHIMIQRFKDSG